MRPVLAIALLSLRSAMRSRMVMCLLLVLAAVIILVPLTIKGDGTMAGFIQVLLSYTLGLTGAVLSMTTFWAGSASVSSEINDKTIQLVGTKPVSKWQVWTGKWIGLNLMNLMLLVCAGAITYGLMRWHLHPSRLTPEQYRETQQLLLARAEMEPDRPDMDALAMERLQQRLAGQPLPADVPAEQALREMRQQLMISEHTIRPSTSKTWNFGLIDAMEDQSELTLRFRFASSLMGQESAQGRWLAGTRERPDIFTVDTAGVPRAVNEVRFPYDPVWREQPLILTYIDLNTDGATLLVDLDRGLVLLVPQGVFHANYVRALLVLAGQLSFFAALGVTAGCLFSLPVAAFVSMFLLLLVQMGGYIQGMALSGGSFSGSVADGGTLAWGSFLMTLIFKGLSLAVMPLMQDHSLTQLSTGVIILPAQVVRAVLMQGLGCAMLMGLFASWVMNRRELALPQS